MYKKVQPVMLTNEGISWLSSKIGKPLNKFVREGTDVRVCLLRDRAVPCPASINIELEEGGEVICIDIISFQARDYKKDTGKQVWIAKEQKNQDASSSGKDVSGMVVQVDVGNAAQVIVEESSSKAPAVAVPVTPAEQGPSGGSGGSSKTKKRRKNRKKNLEKALQSVSGKDADSQAIPQLVILPNSVAGSGNASTSPMGGTEAPASSSAIQGA
ncbi:hypothetical protein LINPERPRIM_LOCUS197 [Linum perenne]